MNLYEKIMILDPKLDENAISEIVEKVKEKIIKQGGEILKVENWGSRKLAYQLNKQDKGYYILLLFKAPPTTILELERYSMITDTIIKIMVIKIYKKKQVEAVMASVAASAEAKPADKQAEPSSAEAKPADKQVEPSSAEAKPADKQAEPSKEDTASQEGKEDV